MNDLEMRLAIAEVCGWTCLDARFMTGRIPDSWTDGSRHQDLPDYPNDLNAIHEAAMSQGLLFRMKMADILASMQGVDPAFATARQRAEAFLRTIGKWKE